VILKRSSSDNSRISNLSERFTSINIDKEGIEKAFSNNIDAVIHTATKYDRGDAKISEIIESNITFPIRLLELAIANHVKIFINRAGQEIPGF
jgi:nucleoside-diphosphate-sugar epimerase